jgi:hypothetical protein
LADKLYISLAIKSSELYVITETTVAQSLDTTVAKPALSVLTALTILCLGIMTWLSYRKVRQFPGPYLTVLSQLWPFNAMAKGDLYLAAERVLMNTVRRPGLDQIWF